jgi:aryl-alcohol dehydrogenase-like predicted oxidoreductase
MPTSSSTPHSSVPTVESKRLCASSNGTKQFASRFSERFREDFFRRTTFGLAVSSIGIGTYLGDGSDAEDAAYAAAIEHAVRCGVNLIDTAINYRCQRSERAVGVAIQRLIAAGETRREQFVICTKGGYIPLDRTAPASRAEYQEYVKRQFIDTEILQPGDIVAAGHSLAPRFLRYCIARSRQNLGVRTIDLYFIHNPEQQLSAVGADELMRRLRAAFEVLEEAVGRGDVGTYGIATWDGLRAATSAKNYLSLAAVVAQARAVAGDSHHLKAVQVPTNLAMPESITYSNQPTGEHMVSVAQAAASLGLTVIGSASLLQGRLTSLSEEIREQFPGQSTDAQRAIAFAANAPGLTTALVGMRSAAHVEENLGVWRPLRSNG